MRASKRTFILVAFAGAVSCRTGRMSVAPGAQDRAHEAAFARMTSTVNAGDATGYASLYAPDAAIVIHGGAGLSGRAAIEGYEVDLLRQFPGTRLALYDIWQQGVTAVVHYGVNSPGNGGPATGHEGLLFYRFDSSGLIVEERRYLDALTPMAQAGALGPAFRPPVPVLPGAVSSHVASGSSEERKNLEIVRMSIVALNARDERAFLATTARDATFDEMLLAGALADRTAAAWFNTWRRVVPDATWEITSKLAAGDAVLVELALRGTLRETFGPFSPSSKSFALHRGAIFRVTSGRIAAMTGFLNGRELAEAIGQWPPMRGR